MDTLVFDAGPLSHFPRADILGVLEVVVGKCCAVVSEAVVKELGRVCTLNRSHPLSVTSHSSQTTVYLCKQNCATVTPMDETTIVTSIGWTSIVILNIINYVTARRDKVGERLDRIDRRLNNLGERVARIEGHLNIADP